jgi:Domain of unknown function (DUF4307)
VDAEDAGLADRYGRRTPRTPRRLRYLVGTVVAVAIGLVVAVVAYRNLGSQPIDAKQTSFDVVNDSSVRVSFSVTRDHPERAADCIVRARALGGEETGRREVYVPPADGVVQRTTLLRTVRRAVTGEVFGCSYTVPPYLSTTGQPSG